MMKQIEDDLFTLTEQGNFDLIFHGVNCFCTAPYAGIAAEFEKRFNISLFGYEQDYYKGKFAKLGNVDIEPKYIHKVTKQVISKEDFKTTSIPALYYKVLVTNCYTQHNPGKDLNVVALLMCLQKIAFFAKANNLRVGFPALGAGIAGGNLEQLKGYYASCLKDVDATLVLKV